METFAFSCWTKYRGCLYYVFRNIYFLIAGVDIIYVSILDYIKLIFLLKIVFTNKKMKNNIQLLFTTKFLNDQKML
jgi:hypothetical protein